MDDIKKENYQLTVYKLSEFQDLGELCVELVSKLVKNKRVKNNGVLKVNDKVKVLYLSFINNNTGNDITWFKKME